MKVKEYYSLPYISNSALKWFRKSPLYCYKRMNNEVKDEETSYKDFGIQVHMAILEPEEFNTNFTVLDFNKPASKQQLGFCELYADLIKSGEPEEKALIEAYTANYATSNTKKNIATHAEKLRTDLHSYIDYLLVEGKYKDVLNNNKFNLIQTIKKSLLNHKKAGAYFEEQFSANVEAFSELPVVWESQIVVDGEALTCKSLIDRLIVNKATKEITLIELKTSFTYEEFLKKYKELDYPHQLAFYWMAVKSYFKKNFPDENFEDYKRNTFIALVTTSQDVVESRLIEVPEMELTNSLNVIMTELRDISWHVFTGQWEHTREYYLGDGIEHMK